MPLVTDRKHVLSVYADAAANGWVMPTLCAENLTTIEASLAAAKECGELIGRKDMPITISIANLYSHRSQTSDYTHTRQWDIGLKLFMADLTVLTSPESPFANLNVMVNLDHVQYESDKELLKWDMNQFSSILFDASSLPFEKNMELTAQFVKERGGEIVIEGACDQISDNTGTGISELTTPDNAQEFARRTGVDFIVANLGTEHRASEADLKYHSDLARAIKERIGTRIVLHGCSSVSRDQIGNLFEDGVCKVNIWTALERDSCMSLFEDMVKNAAKAVGSKNAKRLVDEGLLGLNADLISTADVNYFTACYRQGIIFEEMKKIAMNYLKLWYKVDMPAKV